MTASRHTDRSADDLVRWFRAGGDGARRALTAESANGRSFQDIAHRPSMQTAFATLALGHDPRRRTILGRARTPRQPSIAIEPEAPAHLHPRGFLHWRLSDDGPSAPGRVREGRPPKPFTGAEVGRTYTDHNNVGARHVRCIGRPIRSRRRHDAFLARHEQSSVLPIRGVRARRCPGGSKPAARHTRGPGSVRCDGDIDTRSRSALLRASGTPAMPLQLRRRPTLLDGSPRVQASEERRRRHDATSLHSGRDSGNMFHNDAPRFRPSLCTYELGTRFS